MKSCECKSYKNSVPIIDQGLAKLQNSAMWTKLMGKKFQYFKFCPYCGKKLELESKTIED